MEAWKGSRTRSHLLNCHPLKINSSVFIVPSHRNNYLKLFLSQSHYECLNIRDLHEAKYENMNNYCVSGKVKKFEKLFNGNCLFELADMKDHSCPYVKLYLMDECAKHLKKPHKRCFLYVSCPIRFDSVSSIYSTPSTVCILVTELFYYKHQKLQVPVTFVSEIPFNGNSLVRPSKCQKPVILPHPSEDTVKSQPIITNTNFVYTNSSVKYVSLRELRKDTKVNVIGSVRHFKSSKSTKRGTSFYRTFTIVDSSLSSEKDIAVVAFARMLNDLPNIARVGDIIVMHRVHVSTFRGSMQITYNSHSQFMLFDIRAKIIQPYCMSKNLVFLESDIQLHVVKTIQQWALSNGYLNSHSRLCHFSYIRPGLHFDLECNIMSVKQKDDYFLLTVYDYSKSASRYITIKDHINCSIVPGQTIYFHNVFANPINYDIVSNTVTSELIVTSYAHRGICYSVLPSLERSHIISPYITRISPRVCQAPLSSLANISQCSTVPCLFRSIVRITDTPLLSIEACIKIKCNKCSFFRDTSDKAVNTLSELSSKCLNCKTVSDSQYTYIIPLKIEDKTKSMIIYLWHQYAEALLQYLQPTNAYLNKAFKRNLSKSLEYLVGRNLFHEVSNSNASSPLLECHICSYYSGSKQQEIEREISFFILDTELVY